MHRMVRFLAAVVFFSCPFVASAQSAAPKIDCESAAKPQVDFKTYWDTCRARATAAKKTSGALAAAGATVEGSRTTVSALSFSNVPTWSDADILAQFPLQRDARYMAGSNNPGVQRRISWMYPEDGCFARAEQFNAKVAAAGKLKPHKLFAFGVGCVSTRPIPWAGW